MELYERERERERERRKGGKEKSRGWIFVENGMAEFHGRARREGGRRRGVILTAEETLIGRGLPRAESHATKTRKGRGNKRGRSG